MSKGSAETQARLSADPPTLAFMNDDAPHPGPDQTPAAPLVSPDGKFWWDGTRWAPMNSPEPSTRPGKSGAEGDQKTILSRARNWFFKQPMWRRWLTIGGPTVLLILLFVPAPGSSDWSDITCEDLVAESIALSEDQDGLMRLLKVRSPEVEDDNRESVEPPTGDGEAVILSCQGTGVWSTGGNSGIDMEASIDSDSQVWISYERQ